MGAKDSGKCFAREHHNLSIPSSSRHRNMGRSSSNSAVHAIASSNGCGSGDIGRDDAGVCSSSSHVGLGCCCRYTNGYRESVVGTRRDTPDLTNQSINQSEEEEREDNREHSAGARSPGGTRENDSKPH